MSLYSRSAGGTLLMPRAEPMFSLGYKTLPFFDLPPRGYGFAVPSGGLPAILDFLTPLTEIVIEVNWTLASYPPVTTEDWIFKVNPAPPTCLNLNGCQFGGPPGPQIICVEAIVKPPNKSSYTDIVTFPGIGGDLHVTLSGVLEGAGIFICPMNIGGVWKWAIGGLVLLAWNGGSLSFNLFTGAASDWLFFDVGLGFNPPCLPPGGSGIQSSGTAGTLLGADVFYTICRSTGQGSEGMTINSISISG